MGTGQKVPSAIWKFSQTPFQSALVMKPIKRTETTNVLVEEYLAGREITCGVLGNAELQALPLVEIIPTENYDFFDYEAKYKEGASREICPAPVSPEITRQAQEYGIRAHQVLGLRGYSRTDMIVRGEEIIPFGNQYHTGNDQNQPFPPGRPGRRIDLRCLIGSVD